MKRMTLVCLLICSTALGADQAAEIKQLRMEMATMKKQLANITKAFETLRDETLLTLVDTQKRTGKNVEQLCQRLRAIEAKQHKPRHTPRRPEKKERPKPPKDTLSLVKWNWGKRTAGDWRIHSIKFSLHNGYAKRIKMVHASVRFDDLLGNQLHAFQLEQDLRIPAMSQIEFTHESATKKQRVSDSYRSIPEEIRVIIKRRVTGIDRMMILKPEDVVGKIEVKKIVFGDNSVLQVK